MKAIILATDPAEGDLLRQALTYSGLEAASYQQTESVLAAWSEYAADLVVLADEGEVAPIEQILRIQETTESPLLVIGEKSTEADLRAMLEAGADLVLWRPVAPRIFATYAQVLLRRVDTVPQSMLSAFNSERFSLDPANRTATVLGVESDRLTRLEFRLLYVLVANREQVMPFDMLIERVWENESSGDGDSDLLRGLVSRVRHKIEPDPQNPQFIENLTGVGYRFTTEPPAGE